jgi:hypothetical protein
MKQALVYSLKVWLTTVILGMRVAVLIRILLDSEHLIYSFGDTFSSAAYDIPIGLIVCTPSWVLFAFASKSINSRGHSVIYKNIILSACSIPLIILPYAIVFHQIIYPNYWPDMLPDLCGYALVTVAGIWIYRFNSSKNKEAT